MRICRFDRGSEKDRLGVVEGDKVYDVSAVIDMIEPVRWPVPMGDRMIAALPTLRPKMEELIRNGSAKSYALSDVRLNAPIANPSKFFCGAGNWPEHAAQMNGKNMRNLGWLHKTTNALAGPADDVVLTRPGRVTFYEAELATIIGKEAKNVAAKDALGYVAGYAACLDMSMQGEENFSHNKCYDTFGVIGPWMVTTDEIPDPRPLTFRFYVNDVQKQGDKIERLVLGVEDMIEFASSVATLYPGDVIMSGTPIGLSQVFPGDVMRLEFDVIGTMVNKVAGVV